MATLVTLKLTPQMRHTSEHAGVVGGRERRAETAGRRAETAERSSGRLRGLVTPQE